MTLWTMATKKPPREAPAPAEQEFELDTEKLVQESVQANLGAADLKFFKELFGDYERLSREVVEAASPQAR